MRLALEILVGMIAGVAIGVAIPIVADEWRRGKVRIDAANRRARERGDEDKRRNLDP